MLIAIFCVAFVTTNIVTVKILDLGFWGLTVPCGVIIYPLSVYSHISDSG